MTAGAGYFTAEQTAGVWHIATSSTDCNIEEFPVAGGVQITPI